MLSCWYWCLWLLHNTVYRVIRCENSTLLCIQWSQILYVDTVDIRHKYFYKTHLHISAHNFLNIQPIFNPQKFWKAETEGFSTIPSNTIYMSILSVLGISISNAFNAIYVKAVNTNHIHTFLSITFLIFNWFSICKKFWKAETEAFSTIPSNTIYVDTVNTRHKYF